MIKDLGDEIKKVMPTCEIEYTDMKFEDLRNYRVKNDKILTTGWKPEYNIQDGIKQIYDLIKERRVKDTTDVVYSNAAYMRRLNDF
jgi:nucleoside-diphosphate-sugar epimerase